MDIILEMFNTVLFAYLRFVFFSPNYGDITFLVRDVAKSKQCPYLPHIQEVLWHHHARDWQHMTHGMAIIYFHVSGS